MESSVFPFFITTFTTLFVIIDPIAGAMVFSSITKSMDTKKTRAMANKTAIFGCSLLIFFALTGNLILSFFRITTNSLSVAGGVLLFLISIDMMYAKKSREAYTDEEFEEEREYMYIVPLTVPLLTGPAAITSIILLMGMAEPGYLKITVFLAVILVFILTWILLRFSEQINKILGVTGSMVFRRMMGLFLAAIAVEFMSNGMWNIYNSLILAT